MRNFTIITLILVVPLLAYMILTRGDVSSASKTVDANKPQIIKFTSLMCLDCKKLDKVMKEIYPKYSEKIILIEVPVQTESAFTKKQIEKYNVTLVPTLIFIDAKGKKIRRTEGYVEPNTLEIYINELTGKK